MIRPNIQTITGIGFISLQISQMIFDKICRDSDVIISKNDKLTGTKVNSFVSGPTTPFRCLPLHNQLKIVISGIV